MKKIILKIELGRKFRVLEIDAKARLVLGFIEKDNIAIWHGFNWFSPAQIKRLEKAVAKNGDKFRYY